MLRSCRETLDIEIAGATYGMTERPYFQTLPDTLQAKYATAHPDNQDYLYANPDVGLFVADGVSARPKSAAAARATVHAFVNYLQENAAHTQKLDIVQEMVPYAAEAATKAIYGACGLDEEGDMNGSNTFTCFIRTRNARELLRYHVGDTRGLQARKSILFNRPRVISETIDQVMRLDAAGKPVKEGPPEKLSNFFGSHHDIRLTPEMLEATEFSEFSRLLTDQVDPIEVKLGDLLILYSDGLAVADNKQAYAIDPRIVAALALSHDRPQDAVNALTQLPEKIAADWNVGRDINHFYPKLDDLTIVVGKIIAR